MYVYQPGMIVQEHATLAIFYRIPPDQSLHSHHELSFEILGPIKREEEKRTKSIPILSISYNMFLTSITVSSGSINRPHFFATATAVVKLSPVTILIVIPALRHS